MFRLILTKIGPKTRKHYFFLQFMDKVKPNRHVHLELVRFIAVAAVTRPPLAFSITFIVSCNKYLLCFQNLESHRILS